ncbi:MAG: hypothetical protein KAW83_04665 [Dehalococcoidia bacterium]|nr:hypothetical protein [Dehalococcoidia bacterium]
MEDKEKGNIEKLDASDVNGMTKLRCLIKRKGRFALKGRDNIINIVN